MDFTRYNKTKTFTVETEGFEYKSPEEVVEKYGLDHTHTLRAIFINDGLYGEAVTFATDHEYINVGSHMVETAKLILEDAESVSAINAKTVGFKFRPYENKYGKFYSVEFLNI